MRGLGGLSIGGRGVKDLPFWLHALLPPLPLLGEWLSLQHSRALRDRIFNTEFGFYELGIPFLPERGETQEFYIAMMLAVYAGSLFLRTSAARRPAASQIEASPPLQSVSSPMAGELASAAADGEN